MTPAQREQLNRFLAEKVLGWELVENQQYPWYKRKGGFHVYAKHWHPATSCADCELLLDKLERDGWRSWMLSVTGRYRMTIENEREIKEDGGASRTEALCLAIAKAYGWKEEK